MALERPEAAELREVCVGFAVTAGVTQGQQIIRLADQLKAYIETGAVPATELPADLPASATRMSSHTHRR